VGELNGSEDGGGQSFGLLGGDEHQPAEANSSRRARNDLGGRFSIQCLTAAQPW
jgi:hypothetical protein